MQKLSSYVVRVEGHKRDGGNILYLVGVQEPKGRKL